MAKFTIKKDGRDVVCEVTGLTPDEKPRVRNTYALLFNVDEVNDRRVAGESVGEPIRFMAGTKDGFMGPIFSTDEARAFFGALQKAGIAFDNPTQIRQHIAQVTPRALASLNGQQRSGI